MPKFRMRLAIWKTTKNKDVVPGSWCTYTSKVIFHFAIGLPPRAPDYNILNQWRVGNLHFEFSHRFLISRRKVCLS